MYLYGNYAFLFLGLPLRVSHYLSRCNFLAVSHCELYFAWMLYISCCNPCFLFTFYRYLHLASLVINIKLQAMFCKRRSLFSFQLIFVFILLLVFIHVLVCKSLSIVCVIYSALLLLCYFLVFL